MIFIEGGEGDAGLKSTDKLDKVLALISRIREEMLSTESIEGYKLFFFAQTSLISLLVWSWRKLCNEIIF